MVFLDGPHSLEFTILYMVMVSFLVNICVCEDKQVAAGTISEEDICLPDDCGINEFCCDGECCSNFTRNWFAWSILMVLIFTIIFTCLCVPRLPWAHKTFEPTVHYQCISPEMYEIYEYTTPYKQQPTVSQYHSLVTEEECPPYQPYRYEKLVQQSPPLFNYPEPSAPPKSP